MFALIVECGSRALSTRCRCVRRLEFGVALLSANADG